MQYSQESMQKAFTANVGQAPFSLNFFRDLITIEDCIESQEYEEHKDKLEADKKWFTEHQGDNMETE